MIVDLHKYLIYGDRIEMDRFFELAQHAGFLEFIGLSNKRALEMPPQAKTILSAIKVVRAHVAEGKEQAGALGLSPLELAEQILQWKLEYEKQLEQKRILELELARISPFGYFSSSVLADLERESRRVFQFFCMKSDLAREMILPSEMIYVGTEYDLDYFVAIHKERMQYPKMSEILMERSPNELRHDLQELHGTLAKLERAIHDGSAELPYLQKGLLDALNIHQLQMAKHEASFVLSEALFAVEAWVPHTKIKALFALLSSLSIHAEEIAVEPHDKIPTYQENHGIGKMGEDLVQLYDIPAWTDRDPSIWVLVFFSLFFAMIVSDAGYGLIYLSVGLFLKYRCKSATGTLKRLIKLILIVSSACVVWGVVTASFFGIEIGPDNPYRKYSILHSLAARKAAYHLAQKDDVYEEFVQQYPAVATAQDGHEFLLKASDVEEGKQVFAAQEEFYDNILLEFSLLIGVIHICSSFLRYLGRNPTGFGWIVFVLGGYLYFPSFLEATSLVNFLGWISKPWAYAIGKPLLYSGLISVFLISLWQKKKWGALHELTNSIQVFGDVLSYLRLYALALAGMIMASTFNELAGKVGFFGGILVLLVGHFVNLNLTIMSGVIHGLRLNFIEWYHYSFEGGGRLFNPLRIRKVK